MKNIHQEQVKHGRGQERELKVRQTLRLLGTCLRKEANRKARTVRLWVQNVWTVVDAYGPRAGSLHSRRSKATTAWSAADTVCSVG